MISIITYVLAVISNLLASKILKIGLESQLKKKGYKKNEQKLQIKDGIKGIIFIFLPILNIFVALSVWYGLIFKGQKNVEKMIKDGIKKGLYIKIDDNENNNQYNVRTDKGKTIIDLSDDAYKVIDKIDLSKKEEPKPKERYSHTINYNNPLGSEGVNLSRNVQHINITVNNANVKIYSGSVSNLTVKCSKDFDIEERFDQAIIKEKAINRSSFSNVIIGNSTIITGNCVIVNGKVISGNIIGVDIESSIELIVPKTNDKLSFTIDSQNGYIVLTDINVLEAHLKTMNGSINIEIPESMLNYETSLITMNGKTSKKTNEKGQPYLLPQKRKIKAKTMNGNITVLFKGR